MQEFSPKSAPDVTVAMRRSKQARRISLRVSSLDGRVTLTLPSGTPERVGRAFAEEKARWLREAVGRIQTPVDVAIGTDVPVEGRMLRLAAGQGRAAHCVGDQILAPVYRTGPAVEALLKHMARERLMAAVDAFAGTLDRPFGGVTLRDTRSRWGSCSSDGNLMFSWRLIMAPPRVLAYVAAHEVAHLQHMDHSKAFWSTVEALFPDHREERLWLRKEGPALHRYRFRTQD